jgi:type IV pilus assembly protein PilA
MSVRKYSLWILAGWMAATACVARPQTSSGNEDEKQIRAVYEHFAAAFRAKDVNALMELFAPSGDLFVFDLASDGRRAGLDEHKKYYQVFFADLPASIDEAKIQDLGIVTDGTLAYSHAVLPVSGTQSSGSKSSVTFLITDGLRKIDGKWLIAQEHLSKSPTSAAADLAKWQMAANESSAVASLRTLNTACVTYAAMYGIGYPSSLSDLGTSGESAGQATAKSAGLIDNTLASGTKSGYAFAYTAGTTAAGATVTYTIHAAPISPGQTGERHFFTDESCVIRVNGLRRATKSDLPI